MVSIPGSIPYFSYEAFAGLKYHTPFYAQDFHPGGLCIWWSNPCSTPYYSYEAFAGLKYYTPSYAEDFHPGGLCRWWASPVLSRTSVMRLLRVWSIIPLFTHKISTRVVCVYGEATPVLPRTTVMRLLRVWSIVPLFTHTISTRVVCVNDKYPLFYPVLQLWRFCGFDVLYLFLWSARSS